jgi:hypothetical protein
MERAITAATGEQIETAAVDAVVCHDQGRETVGQACQDTQRHDGLDAEGRNDRGSRGGIVSLA